jgi:hypothetical protein
MQIHVNSNSYIMCCTKNNHVDEGFVDKKTNTITTVDSIKNKP